MTFDPFADLEAEKQIPDGVALAFDAERISLEKALSAVSTVVPGKHHLAVLTNFHLRVQDSTIRVTGTDGGITVFHEAPTVKTAKEGSALFPADKLLSIMRSADEPVLRIHVVSKKGKMSCTISTAKTKWQFPLDDRLKHFPVFESSVLEHELTETDRAPFYEALMRVRKSISTDPMRPYLMMADVSDGRMRSSDSHRFQQIKFKFPFDCQIPLRVVQELTNRLVSSNLEKVEVGQTDKHLLYRVGPLFIISGKDVAQFPDVDEVMVKPNLANDQDLTVDRKALLSAIKRTRITADENTSAVVLSLNKGSVTVQTKDYHGGVAVEKVDAKWEHSPRHVAFNHQHLTDLLSSTSSDSCTFRLGPDLKTKPTPLLMEDTAEGFMAVLSQIRIDWME